MHRDLFKVLVSLVLVVTISGCGRTMQVGTGQMFTQAVNPEPEKFALVYFFRKDGALTTGIKDFPPYLIAKSTPSSTEQFPVTILGNKMYRPLLFEPGEMTFSVKAGGSEKVIIKAGESRCIDASRAFRGLSVIGVSEVSLDKCLEELKGLELAKTITELRKRNGGTPLLQPGFKDLDLSPLAVSSNP